MPRYRLRWTIITNRLTRTRESRERVAEFPNEAVAREEAQALRDRLVAEQGSAWVWLKRLDPPEPE